MKDSAAYQAASAGQQTVETSSVRARSGGSEREPSRVQGEGGSCSAWTDIPAIFQRGGHRSVRRGRMGSCATPLIGNERGELVFEQRDVEIPKFWSQQATNIVVSKYFRGQIGTPEREHSVKQLIGRVVNTITAWGKANKYFASDEDLQAFSDDLKHILVYQKAAFNSPVWFNCGFEKAPQCSACFINSVQDTMDSILTLARTEGMLFKFGSGTGTNLSPIRSSKELLAGGGTASGPVSFMKGYDAFAGVIKSGGKTRRAAKMVILNADHPDIVEFINCKVEEEKKAWALIDAGYDGSFTGPAYSSVFFQNSNNSVRVTDEFMRAVLDDSTWDTHAVRDGSVLDTYKARDLMRLIAEGTHICGDPGMQFDTTVNEWHTCPETDRIHASNPCSEYMFLNDSACNLASINLMKFVKRGTAKFDVVALQGGHPDAHHRAGDHRRQRELSERSDWQEQPRVSSARPRLCQPRRAAHVARPAVRQRRRPRLRGGADRSDDRRGLCPVGADCARLRRPVQRLREEQGTVPPGDAQAPRLDARCQRAERAAGPVPDGKKLVGRCGGAWRAVRLPQRPGDGAGADRHHRLHDGLRYDRRRAGHRARQIQEARRRRVDEDRQPDGADGAQEARLLAAAGRRDRRLHRQERDDRRGACAEGVAPRGVRLRVQGCERPAVDSLHGAHQDDGGDPALHLGRDFRRP